MRKSPLLFLLLVMFLPFFAFAQGSQAGGQNSLLPEINPQDIEIRSEFKARFPGLRRQPILGFNPKPRVFRIAPNRMPFMESKEEAVADISVTKLGRPEPPARILLQTPTRRNALIRAGLGSFLTPEITGYGFYELNDNSLVTGDMNLRSSDGHLSNQESSFRYFDLNGKYITQLKKDLKVSVAIGGLSDFNNLSDAFQQPIIGSTADKKYSGLSGQLSFQKMKNTLTGWDFSVGTNLFSTELNAGNSGLSGDLDEQLFHTSFSYYWPSNRMYETYNIIARVEGGSYESSLARKQNWVDARGGIEYARLFNYNTHVKAVAGFAYISDPFSDSFYFAPEIEVKHNFNNALSITGSVFAKPEMRTVQDHQQYNRFLYIQTQLRDSYQMGASGEVNFQLFDGNRIFGGVDYSHIRDYAYYQRTTLGFYDVNYANANIFKLYFGASQQLVPEKFWADANVYIRSPQLAAGGTIPYEEKLGLKATLSYKPIKALTINGWAEYIGSRESPETTSNLSAFALLNAGGEYQINDTFGVYAKVLNVLGQKYEIWDGYQERPFQIFGGLTIKL